MRTFEDNPFIGEVKKGGRERTEEKVEEISLEVNIVKMGEGIYEGCICNI